MKTKYMRNNSLFTKINVKTQCLKLNTNYLLYLLGDVNIIVRVLRRDNDIKQMERDSIPKQIVRVFSCCMHFVVSPYKHSIRVPIFPVKRR